MNKKLPPPPAVIGPPPKPNRDAYLPLLPPSVARKRSDTSTLRNEVHEILRLSQPSSMTPRAGLPSRQNSSRGAPRVPPRRTQSDRNMKENKETKFEVQETTASKYGDFTQWKNNCPPTIMQGIEFIAHYGLFVEGIFRVSGDYSKILLLMDKAKQGPGSVYSGLNQTDVYNVADFLLRWTQEYFGGLIPSSIYKKLMETTKEGQFPKKIIKGLIFSLPPEQIDTLFSYLQLCQVIMEKDVTKMTPKALATCIAPNLMFDPNQCDMKTIQVEAEQSNSIFEFLIEDFPYLLQVCVYLFYSELVLTEYKDLSSGRSVQLSSRASDSAEEIGRGRSVVDDRKSRNPFRRLSRSRSRKRNGSSIKQ